MLDIGIASMSRRNASRALIVLKSSYSGRMEPMEWKLENPADQDQNDLADVVTAGSGLRAQFVRWRGLRPDPAGPSAVVAVLKQRAHIGRIKA